MHANLKLVKCVLNDLDISQNALKYVAGEEDVACMSENYAYVLGKLTSIKAQEKAVKGAVKGMCNGMMEALEPFFWIFYDHAFLNPNLKEVAMLQTFESSIQNTVRDKAWIMPLFDQHVISAKVYSNALYSFHDYKLEDNALFDWLLERADSIDLDFVMKYHDFQRQNDHFKQSIEGARKVVDDAYRRHGITKRKSVLVFDVALGKVSQRYSPKSSLNTCTGKSLTSTNAPSNTI